MAGSASCDSIDDVVSEPIENSSPYIQLLLYVTWQTTQPTRKMDEGIDD